VWSQRLARHGRVTRDRHGRVDLGTCRARLASLGSCERLFRGREPAKAGSTGCTPIRVTWRWSRTGAAASSLRQAGATGVRHAALRAARDDGNRSCASLCAESLREATQPASLRADRRSAWQSRSCGGLSRSEIATRPLGPLAMTEMEATRVCVPRVLATQPNCRHCEPTEGRRGSLALAEGFLDLRSPCGPSGRSR
jgi:hypothetical protein